MALSLDNQIIRAENAVREAKDRKDTRSMHVALATLRDLRHRRMRRDRRLGLFKSASEVAATLAMFAIGAATYCVATIMEAYPAYAATADMVVSTMPLAHKLGAYFLLASIITALVWALLGFRNPRDDAPLFDDPDKPIRADDFRRQK